MILYLVNKWEPNDSYYVEEHFRSLASGYRSDMVSLFPTTSGWLYLRRTTELKRKLNGSIPNEVSLQR